MTKNYIQLHNQMYQRHPDRILHLHHEIDSSMRPCHIFGCDLNPCHINRYYYYLNSLFFSNCDLSSSFFPTFRIEYYSLKQFVISAMLTDDVVYAECFPFLPNGYWKEPDQLAMFNYFQEPCAVDLSKEMSAILLRFTFEMEALCSSDKLKQHSIYFNYE